MEINKMKKLSERARTFLSHTPTRLGAAGGYTFYEHPFYGDEDEIWMITPEGKIKRTGFWDVADCTIENLEGES